MDAGAMTATDDTFDPTEMNYLENKFTNLAIDSKRYIVKNGNEPSLGNVIDKNGITKNDIVFNSPSGAACFVIFGSVNGMDVWKTDVGKSLKMLEN